MFSLAFNKVYVVEVVVMRKFFVLSSLAVITASVLGMHLDNEGCKKLNILSSQQIRERFEEVKNYCQNNEQGQKINAEFFSIFKTTLYDAYKRSDFYVDGMTINGKNVMDELYERGSADLVKYLISLGADILRRDKYGYTPFENASGAGNFDVVKLIFDPTANYSEEMIPILSDLRSEVKVDIVGYILGNTDNTGNWISNKISGHRLNLAEHCSLGSNWALVQILIELGAKVSDEIKSEAESKGKDTELYKRLKSVIDENRAAKVVKEATQKNEPGVTQKKSQETAGEATDESATAEFIQREVKVLSSAIRKGKVNIVRRFVERGVAITNEMLENAILGGNLDILKCCVEQGGGAKWITEDMLEIAEAAECGEEMINYLEQHLSKE